jgi:hypothetical protein
MPWVRYLPVHLISLWTAIPSFLSEEVADCKRVFVRSRLFISETDFKYCNKLLYKWTDEISSEYGENIILDHNFRNNIEHLESIFFQRAGFARLRSRVIQSLEKIDRDLLRRDLSTGTKLRGSFASEASNLSVSAGSSFANSETSFSRSSYLTRIIQADPKDLLDVLIQRASSYKTLAFWKRFIIDCHSREDIFILAETILIYNDESARALNSLCLSLPLKFHHKLSDILKSEIMRFCDPWVSFSISKGVSSDFEEILKLKITQLEQPTYRIRLLSAFSSDFNQNLQHDCLAYSGHIFCHHYERFLLDHVSDYQTTAEFDIEKILQYGRDSSVTHLDSSQIDIDYQSIANQLSSGRDLWPFWSMVVHRKRNNSLLGSVATNLALFNFSVAEKDFYTPVRLLKIYCLEYNKPKTSEKIGEEDVKQSPELSKICSDGDRITLKSGIAFLSSMGVFDFVHAAFLDNRENDINLKIKALFKYLETL